MKDAEEKRLEEIRRKARAEVIHAAYQRDRFHLPLENFEHRDDARRVGPGSYQKINRQNKN